jgi:NADH-ubiquinone oxidoreductase chain 2
MIFSSILILIIAKAVPLINKNLTSIYFSRISAIILIYSGVLSLNTLYIQSIGSGIGIYSGLFQVTQISISIESFLLLTGALILFAWPSIIINRTTENDQLNNFIAKSEDYSLIILFSTLGSCLLISCFDLISLYISIELQSFGLYVLATLFKDSLRSTKAGLKYFLLGGLSSCIILFGCGLIYTYTGLTNFESIYSLISTSNSLNVFSNLYLISDINDSAPIAIQGLSIGLVFVFIGFLFKIAAAPLHNWSPDVYDEVPTIVTIWLTIIPKIAIIVLLLELQYYGLNLINISDFINVFSETTNFNYNIELNNTTIPVINLTLNDSIFSFKNLLLISSLLSLIIGTVVGLAQTKIKRLLAYSTISHIGFILLALAINSESSIDSLLFYIIQYTVTNLNIFLIIIAFSYIYSANSSEREIKDINFIKELKGQFISNPILTLSLTICLFSMAGIPPLIGFFSKQFVLYSAIQNGYYFIAYIAIIVSVISASYYLKVVKIIYTDSEEENLLKPENYNTKKNLINGEISISLTNLHSFLIAVLTLSILLFILKPSLILNSTQLLSLSIFNY